MEARIVEFPATQAPAARPAAAADAAMDLPSPAPAPAVIAVGADRLVVERLVLVDPALAAFVAERSDGDRPALVERALRIGLLALQDAGVTVNVDIVRNEFDKLLRSAEQTNEKAALALEQTLRANFADDEGRLPRTLERFLGDRGQLRTFVNELFDETKRDSAIGRMRQLLGTYFDGDASRLATLLDPTRLGSPLHQFRQEVTAGFASIHEKLAALEAAQQARAGERAKGTAKGADFEDLLEALLGGIARGSGDLLDRTGLEAGDTMRSKKGDFVLTLGDGAAPGADLRIVIEAKDRPMSSRAVREELREAKANRSAAVALICFTPAHAPAGVAPFDVRGGDVWCVVDPESPDAAMLEAAVRLARLLALASLDRREVEIDAAAIDKALEGIREQLEAVRSLRAQLTSIRTATTAVWEGLDKLRNGVLSRVVEAEAQLR